MGLAVGFDLHTLDLCFLRGKLLVKRLFDSLNEVFTFNPSAENLSRFLFLELKKHFPVTAVTVWESEDASATYSEDQ